MKNFNNEQQHQKEIELIPILEITFMNDILDLTLAISNFDPPPLLCHFESGQLVHLFKAQFKHLFMQTFTQIHVENI